MTWSSIENQAFRADAKRVLTRMAEIMEHPAIGEHSWFQNDMDNIAGAMDALRTMKEPSGMVDRLMNERAMEAVENGLYWSMTMLNRNGFQEGRGIAWDEGDRKLAEDTLKEYEQLMLHQRN